MELSSQQLADKINESPIICIDGSYVIYHMLYAAVRKWTEQSLYSSVITDADINDPSFEQVDLLIYDDFKETIRDTIFVTLNRIYQLIADFKSERFIQQIDEVFFVLDPLKGSKLHSWRYLIYPEYKGTRASRKQAKPFNVMKIFYAIEEELLENNIYANKIPIRFLYADACEADDIIATIMLEDSNLNKNRLLIASDHDYLQLDNVKQMTLEGKEVVIEQPYPELIKVTPELYLLSKIITGDVSDNITQVFNRVGYKTACKRYLANLEVLQESLEHDKVAFDKFKRNSKLIDFKRIPTTIKELAREQYIKKPSC